MHCENTTFAYDNEFNKYMKAEGAVSKDLFDYLFDVGAEKFLSENGKKYLLNLFEKWDLELFQFNKDYDEYPDNNGLQDIIRDKGM